MTLRADLRRTLQLAAPAAFAQLGLMAMGIVDTAMVGPLGAVPLAAVSLGNSMFFLPTIVCMGILFSLDPIVSQAYGEGDHAACGRAYVAGVRLAIWMALPLCIVCAFSSKILEPIGMGPEVADEAGAYLTLVAGSAPFMLVFVAQRSFLQGLGKTQPALWAALFANLVNAALNWVLIYGELGAPRLGVGGAALSTVAARATMVLAMAWILYRRKQHAPFGVPGAATHVDFGQLGRLLRLGWPIGAQLLFEVGMFASVAVMMGWVGAAAQAAHQIAMVLASTSFMLPLGVSIATSVRVGHAVGAGDQPAARRAARVGIGLGLALMGLFAILFWTAAEPLVRLFTNDEEVVAVGVRLVWVAAAFQLFDGLQVVTAGALRGAGDTNYPMRINLIADVVIALPACYLLGFPLGFGPTGMWWGFTIGLGAMSALLLWRWRSGLWWDHRLRPQG